jgi:hypothetical protein
MCFSGVLHLPDVIRGLDTQYRLLLDNGSRLQSEMQDTQQRLMLLGGPAGPEGPGAHGRSSGTPLLVDDGGDAGGCGAGSGRGVESKGGEPEPGAGPCPPIQYECEDPDRVPPYTVRPVTNAAVGATSVGSASGTAVGAGAGAGAGAGVGSGSRALVVRPQALSSPQPSPLRGHLVHGGGSSGARRSSSAGGTDALVTTMETHQ